jgi:hypothetical protein
LGNGRDPGNNSPFPRLGTMNSPFDPVLHPLCGIVVVEVSEKRNLGLKLLGIGKEPGPVRT